MTKMIESSGEENDSLGARLEWPLLVATAAGGAAVFVDIMLFEHRHMDAVGALAFAVALTTMLMRKGRT